jgi:P-type Ca2+ transporter type 2C
MTGNTVTIVEDGKLINTDEDHLHKDDLVVLQAGDMVPADLKLVEARGLEIDEFDITGEIMPVIKEVYGDDVILYMGSRVIRGAGKGIVVATGGQTEYGKVLKQELEDNKPYAFKIIKTKYVGLVGLLLPALVIHLARSNNDAFVIASYFLWSVILILLQNNDLFQHVLVSNELKRLERFNIHIRDVSAIAWMHKVDLMCFDKTGVLTTRYMEVKNFYFADGMFPAADELSDSSEGSIFRVIKIACALCNDVLFYEKIDLANPIDKALMSFAVKNGMDVSETLSHYQRVYDVPFDSENRYMACGFERDGQEVYFLKGDPDVVLSMCSDYVTATGAKKKMDWEFWSISSANINAISQNGDTAIALAYTTEIPGRTPIDYTFLCLFQLENPLQPGVRETIRGITENGIRSILLTGDRAKTAVRVGQDCGITKDSRACLTGRMINGMESAEVARQSSYCSVFARLTPSQKGFLIRLLQQKGHCIAMVGDGPNDGIALKVADVGISYVKNSSPFARRLSKILISDLADLLRLIESANRIERSARHLKLFRIVIIAVSLFSIYTWVFTLY